MEKLDIPENNSLDSLEGVEEMPLKENAESDAKHLERAQTYWESRLKSEHRIETPQKDECIFSIVVPVYNEKVDRIKKQIDSLRAQSIGVNSFEVIYVVNNGVIAEGSENEDILRQNKAMIDFLHSVNDLSVYVIDKSTKDNEILDCNVGKARNRGVAEASLRFYEAGKNGILIQTDADSYFEDTDYLTKIQSVFQDSSEIIGIAGGLVFEFDPDTDSPEIRAELEKKMERLILMKKFGILNKFIKKGKVYSSFKDNTFSGANMISKSFETAVIGGLIDEAAGEDPQFSRDLIEYGARNNKKVLGMKNDLKVITALRDSDRTPSSFKKIFDSMDLARPLEIDGQIITPELIHTLEGEALKRDGGEKLIENMRKMIEEIRVAKV